MGKLLYGSLEVEVEFDDRTLSHLQAVIGAKLRRGESFFLSWVTVDDSPDPDSSVWLSSAIPLMFTYSNEQVSDLNREWLRLLDETTLTGRGLSLVAEPEAAAVRAQAR